jgi:hypothetical protein
MNPSKKQLKKEHEYLDKYVFYGLKNLNDGFDAPSIKYFSEEDFAVVLNRVKDLGLGIWGIEPWKNGEYYAVVTCESETNDPTDFNWYMKVFEDFKNHNEPLQYSATYIIPDKILNK